MRGIKPVWNFLCAVDEKTKRSFFWVVGVFHLLRGITGVFTYLEWRIDPANGRDRLLFPDVGNSMVYLALAGCAMGVVLHLRFGADRTYSFWQHLNRLQIISGIIYVPWIFLNLRSVAFHQPRLMPRYFESWQLSCYYLDGYTVFAICLYGLVLCALCIVGRGVRAIQTARRLRGEDETYPILASAIPFFFLGKESGSNFIHTVAEDYERRSRFDLSAARRGYLWNAIRDTPKLLVIGAEAEFRGWRRRLAGLNRNP
jgi:hypothetical protein